MTEAKLQRDIIRYLKSKGCYVIKHSAGAGVPVGCPDLSFYLEGCYGFIEVKATSRSRYQPLQKETLEKLNGWSWARRVDPSNWDEVKQELERML
jgi:Holliday junction resolvase